MPIGTKITTGKREPIVAAPFIGRRWNGSMIDASVERWADENRKVYCPDYDKCLDAAVAASVKGTLSGTMTWSCKACPRFTLPEENKPNATFYQKPYEMLNWG